MGIGFADSNSFPGHFRKKELRKIFECVKRSQSVQLVAPTGSGKSLILKAITESKNIARLYMGEDTSNFKFALVDLKFSVEKDLKSLLGYISKKLNFSRGKATNLQFDEVVTKLIEQNGHLVIIFDSFNEIPNPASLFTILKAVYDEHRGKLCYIFAVNHQVNLRETMNEFRHLGALLTENVLFLTPLVREDFDWFIGEQESYLNMKLSTSEYQKLFKLTGGYMATAKRIMETMKDRISLVEIEKAPEKIERINYHFQTLLKDFMAESGSLINLVNKRAALTDLANIKYLQKTNIINSDNQITIPLFQTYLENVSRDSNIASHEVITDKIIINSSLTAQEHKIIKYLSSKLNRFCSRDEIIENIWGENQNRGVSDHALDQIIYRLRKKLEKNDPQLKIETVWGRGHKAILTS